MQFNVFGNSSASFNVGMITAIINGDLVGQTINNSNECPGNREHALILPA
jgi:hypothetical protein